MDNKEVHGFFLEKPNLRYAFFITTSKFLFGQETSLTFWHYYSRQNRSGTSIIRKKLHENFFIRFVILRATLIAHDKIVVMTNLVHRIGTSLVTGEIKKQK